MQIWLFTTYIITIFAIIITPGPNAMLMVSHSLQNGKNAIYANAIGGVLAAALLISLSLLGINSFISKKYLFVFSVIGAGYLIYLGVSNIRKKEAEFITKKNKKSHNFFIQSFLTGLSNPKDILFFIVFYHNLLIQVLVF